MSDNKKYYYMRLKESFFDSDEMIILEGMTDGYLYSNILLKLYLRSLKDDGRLMFKGVIPYTPDVLSKVVRHNVGVVEKAIQIFKQLGLVEILDNGAIYMLDIQNYIGKSSTEAERKKFYRDKIEKEKQLGHLSGHLSDGSPDNSPPEKEIEKKKDKKISGTKVPTRTNFSPPSLEQVKEYCESRDKGVDAERWYDHYTANGWKVGKNQMKDWKAAVRTWERKTDGTPRGPKQRVSYYEQHGEYEARNAQRISDMQKTGGSHYAEQFYKPIDQIEGI